VKISGPFYWREASLCVPALPILFIAGFAAGVPILGAVAAGAAYAVGFGAARGLLGRRWGAMIAATVGMSVATFIGSVSGGLVPVQILLAGAAAAGCAALALYNEDLWWVSLQVVIALLVASTYPGSFAAGVHRAAAVLVGGTTQTFVAVLLARIFPAIGGVLPASPPPTEPTRRLLFSHMARAAICVVAALFIARAAGLANSYWAPMTALLILKPGLHETRTRGLSRLGGTILGCLIATAYSAIVDFSPPLVLAGVAIAAGLSYATQKAHYAVLTCAITATVVLLVSLGTSGVLANAQHRLIATAIGGIVALVVAQIAPHRAALNSGAADRVGAG
jgi:hypothetical protein